jgi:outer membrane protein TolC
MISGLLVLALLGADAAKPAHVGVTSTRQLSLREAIELAVRDNLDVEIVRTDEAGAKASLEAAQAFTDLGFRWNPGYQERSVPAPSLLEAADGKLTEHYDTQNFYLHQQSPWNGASFDLAFENSRVSSENPFLGVNPFYTSQLTLSFIQPLWRNRDIDAARATLLVRAKQTELSRTDLELRLIEVITRVEQAYWDLAAARQNSEVLGESVELAGKQLERDRNRIAAGTLAQVESSESEAERARRQDLWYASEALVTEQENALKRLLSGSRGAEIWNQEIVPSEQEALAPVADADVQALVADAVKARPELRGIAVRQQITGIEKRQNENLVKPQVNLVGSYSLAGLGGKLNTAPDPITASITPIVNQINTILVPLGEPAILPPTLGTLPGHLVGGYGTNLENLFAGRYQSVQAGLQVDLTFRNRAAKAAVEQSVIAERREKLEQAQTEQAIEAQVRDALESLAIAKQRREAAQTGERAAREKLDSETRLFETGESTNFLALTRQNEYSEARRRLLVAVLEYNKAVSRLRQATGTTLAVNQVAVK